MNSIIVIETSSSPFGILLGNKKKGFFNSTEILSLQKSRDIQHLVNYGLEAAKKRIEDIDFVAVNIGPGGLSSIRAGVSFANALAYGLDIPVYPFTSFELMGIEAWEKFHLPVLCTARANEGNVYAALYDKNKIVKMRFGLLETIIPEMVANVDTFAVAGAHREHVQNLFNKPEIVDSGIQKVNVAYFFKMDIAIGRKLHFPDFPSPITESSRILYEQS